MERPLDALVFPLAGVPPVEHLRVALALLAPYEGYRIGFSDGSTLDVEAIRRRISAAVTLLEGAP